MALLNIPGTKKERNHFDVFTSDQEQEVRTTSYGPENDQSQRAKSVSQRKSSSYEGPKSARRSFIFCSFQYAPRVYTVSALGKRWSISVSQRQVVNGSANSQ